MTLDQWIASTKALLELDAKGAIAPHGIGGHARSLLTDALGFLHHRNAGASPMTKTQELEVVAWRVKDFADGWMLSNIEAVTLEYQNDGHLVEPLVSLSQAQSALAAVSKERDEAMALVNYAEDVSTTIIARAETAEAQVQRLTEDNEALTALHADCARRLVTAEARIKALESALRLIDAHDPESAVNGCSPDALRGLVNRMGGISRATLNSREKVDG